MKIQITIQDAPNNKVTVVANPSFETMASMINSGQQTTSAQAYALLALRSIREEAKKQTPQSKILIPTIGRS